MRHALHSQDVMAVLFGQAGARKLGTRGDQLVLHDLVGFEESAYPFEEARMNPALDHGVGADEHAR